MPHIPVPKPLSNNPNNWQTGTVLFFRFMSQKPGKMIVDSLKIKKTKKEKMPMDALVIYSLSGGREVIDSLKTFRLAEKADWVAFQKGRKDSTLYVQP